MKALIIYASYHRMNTEKVAQDMAGAMAATLVKAGDVRPEVCTGYDLIGFGSGIYGGKHHRSLFTLIETMPRMEKNVFIFSTSGVIVDQHHQPLRDALAGKGCTIVGEFRCPGEVSPLGFNLNLKGPLGWLAGKNRGHPDEKDLENARVFAKGLLRPSSDRIPIRTFGKTVWDLEKALESANGMNRRKPYLRLSHARLRPHSPIVRKVVLSLH